MMDAIERFNNPAKFLVEKANSAIWHVIDKHTIRFQTAGVESPIIDISSDGEGQYDLDIVRTGKLSVSYTHDIAKMHAALQEECKYHKIKRACLRVPKPEFIHVSYNSEDQILRIFDKEKLVYSIGENSAPKAHLFDVHPTITHYFHELVLKMIHV